MICGLKAHVTSYSDIALRVLVNNYTHGQQVSFVHLVRFTRLCPKSKQFDFDLFQTIHELFKADPSMKTVAATLSVSKPPLRTFLNKCTELLWYMQIQEPPVYLEFSPAENPFMYRPFKDNNSQLDSIIWPAVKLHRHGPGLRKGVALFSQLETSSPAYEEYEESEKEMLDTEDDTTKYYLFTEDTSKFYYFTK